MGRASLRRRGELVADGREQGMREAHGSPHLDHAVPLGRRERCQDMLRGAVRGCDRLRGRVPGRGGDEQDLDRLDRELGEAGAKQLPEAVRDRQRLAGLELRAAADELAAELEREERVAAARLPDPSELGPGELEAKPGLEQPVQRADAERAERQPRQPALPGTRARARSAPRHPPPRAPSRARRSARSAGAATRSEARRWSRSRAIAESSTATSTGPRFSSSRSASRIASPTACACGGSSSGSAKSSAISSARRRGERERALTSPRISRQQLREPGEANPASASTPRQNSTVGNRARASASAVSKKAVLPIPGSPETTRRCGAGEDLGEEDLQ